MLKDAFAAIRRLLLLEERVRELTVRVERQDALLLDYRDRLVRIEALIEYAQRRQARRPLPSDDEETER